MKKIKNYGLSFKKSITAWDEALPIGNGNLGALIYGDGPIKYAIDSLSLWDMRKSESSSDKDFNYRKLCECVSNGDVGWQRKREIFEKNGNFPYPTKLSAGKIELDFGEHSDKFCSELDIQVAVATIYGESFRLESFVLATHPIGVIKVKGEYRMNLHIPGYFSGDENGEWSKPSGLFFNTGEAHIVENGCLKYPRTSVKQEDNFTYYVQNSLTDYSFSVIIYTKKHNDFDEIYYTVTSNEDDADFLSLGKKRLTEAAEYGYDCLLSEHTSYWKKYWKKSHISIRDKDMERAYYFNWYLFASTSRKGGLPMPLQGVWTADSDAIPPWNGDYHHDTNTEMSYWGYAKANRLDEGRVFADYLWKQRDKFRIHAKSVYGVDGYLIPGCSTRDGDFMGGCVEYSLSPSMTIWAAKAFDDYFRYTGDSYFLKSRAFPFFKGVADAIISLLVLRDGKYYLPLSTSPEILEEERAIESFHIGNTTFDQSLLLYFFKTIIDYCNRLSISSKEYEAILSNMDDIYVSENCEIMLSEKMNLPYSHRHFSHLMCIYPLQLINYDTPENKKLIDNSLWELERLGTGWWVGFSFPWCATLYAMAENGGAAYEKLRAFIKGFISPNGFHLNGDYKRLGFSQWHYRPFTLEALYAFNDSIQEMLMQDHKGYIDLFPAIPDEWKEASSFKKFNTVGGISVSAEIKKNKISVILTAKENSEILLKNRFSSDQIILTDSKHSALISIKNLDMIKLSLSKGKTQIKEID